jgi:hypothetical protein
MAPLAPRRRAAPSGGDAIPPGGEPSAAPTLTQDHGLSEAVRGFWPDPRDASLPPPALKVTILMVRLG